MSSALPDTGFSIAIKARICRQSKGVCVMITLLALAQTSSALPGNGFSIAMKDSVGTQASIGRRERKLSQADDITALIDKGVVCIA